MRQGFSLTEIVLVLAVVGLLIGIAVPSLFAVLDVIEVGAATHHLVAAHRRARMMAITRSQTLVLSIDSSSLSIRPANKTVPLWTEPGPAANRVSLEGPLRQFTFSPQGITFGFSNATLRLARGAASRTIVVSRLGRVRITE
jgi:prepilin-type N-terminal cleavage/methylation domain-containing protein